MGSYPFAGPWWTPKEIEKEFAAIWGSTGWRCTMALGEFVTVYVAIVIGDLTVRGIIEVSKWLWNRPKADS